LEPDPTGLPAGSALIVLERGPNAAGEIIVRNAAARQARNRLQRAVERTVPLSFCVYSLVIVWYTLHGYHPDDLAHRRSDQPWYPHKDEPAFEDMLAKLRRTTVAARITGVAAAQPDPHKYRDTNWPAPLPPHNCETQASDLGTENYEDGLIQLDRVTQHFSKPDSGLADLPSPLCPLMRQLTT
jgi:hypothetical protein